MMFYSFIYRSKVFILFLRVAVVLGWVVTSMWELGSPFNAMLLFCVLNC